MHSVSAQGLSTVAVGRRSMSDICALSSIRPVVVCVASPSAVTVFLRDFVNVYFVVCHTSPMFVLTTVAVGG